MQKTAYVFLSAEQYTIFAARMQSRNLQKRLSPEQGVLEAAGLLRRMRPAGATGAKAEGRKTTASEQSEAGRLMSRPAKNGLTGAEARASPGAAGAACTT